MVRKSPKIEEIFPRFVKAQMAKGVSDKTVATYQGHFRALSVHLDMGMTFDELTKEDLDSMLVSLRKSGVSPNTISSYARVFRTFLKWCKAEGYTDLSLPNIQDKERRNVDVYFEQENLWLHDQQMQMLITFFFAFAQNESENMSRNVRRGIHQGFKQGTSRYADFTCYGFHQDAHGNLSVDDREAEVVREIFEMRADSVWGEYQTGYIKMGYDLLEEMTVGAGNLSEKY